MKLKRHANTTNKTLNEALNEGFFKVFNQY